MRRSQGGPRLLRQVGGRQHATAEDHADEPPKSPRRDLALGINTDNEDFDREPDSSEDESVNGTDAHFKRANLSYIAHASSQSNPARRISPSSNHGIKLGNKRANPHEHDNDDHDDDAIFESSQGSEKRRKLGGAIPAFVNALAPQRDARRRKALPQKYGRTSNKSAVDKQPEKKSFKKPGSGTALTEKPVKVASFQKLQSRIKGGREESGAAEGKEDGQTDDEMLRNDIRDIETEQDSLRCQCPICGKPVGILVREEFEDEHRHQFRGRRMNFQWQKRFCLHHQVLAARETWQERRYPQIDWSTLDSKMQKHEAFLLQVVRDTTHSRSYYREELRTRLQPGSRSIKQSFHASRPGASVGYYGPRGERVMYAGLSALRFPKQF